MTIMVKLPELRTEAEVHERDMHDLGYRREIERTQLASDVAIKVIRYRADRGLTQAALARLLGMRQPHVARLEAGEHEPSVAMLGRLADMLGLDSACTSSGAAPAPLPGPPLMIRYARRLVTGGRADLYPGELGAGLLSGPPTARSR